MAAPGFPLLIEDELLGVVAYFSRWPLPTEIVEVLTTFIAMVTTALNDVQLFVREQTACAEAEQAEQRFAYGAITFIWAESDRRYSEADLALAESLGRRAATAVDNARLYREVQLASVVQDF